MIRLKKFPFELIVCLFSTHRFTLFLLAALATTSVDAASYQKIDGTIVDPIQYRGGGDHPYSGSDLMPDADLTNANLTGADLTGADLTGATLTDATLTAAVSSLSGLSTTGAFNAWQKILNPGVNASADITQVNVMLSNTGAPVSVVLKIYDGESDALSMNPYTRFDGLTPVATSPAVSVSTATWDSVSFEFDLSAYTLTANTYSFWLQESGDGFLGGVIVQLDIGGSDGGSGNWGGTLNHEVLSNANLYYADLSYATFSPGTILYDGQTVAQHGFDAAGLQAYLEASPVNASSASNLTLVVPEPSTLILALAALALLPLRRRR